MKKAILFYTEHDKFIEKDIPALQKYLENKKYKFETSRIGKDPFLAHKYNVMVSPVVILFEDKKERDRLVGTPKDILAHMKEGD